MIPYFEDEEPRWAPKMAPGTKAGVGVGIAVEAGVGGFTGVITPSKGGVISVGVGTGTRVGRIRGFGETPICPRKARRDPWQKAAIKNNPRTNFLFWEPISSSF